MPCELLVVKGGTHGFGGHDGFSDQEMPHALAATNAWFETHLLPKTIAKPDVDDVANVKAPESAVDLASQYAVADLSAGPSGPWPVSQLAAAPADLLTNDAWRTTKLLLRKNTRGKLPDGVCRCRAGSADVCQ